MPKGRRVRYFAHRNGFDDGTAYVRYEGDISYLVVVERATRELRSDIQRVDEGIWRELTAKQAADFLQQKRGARFDKPMRAATLVGAVDPVDEKVAG